MKSEENLIDAMLNLLSAGEKFSRRFIRPKAKNDGLQHCWKDRR